MDYFVPLELMEPIDVSSLLNEFDLPIRVINYLKRQTFYSEKSFYDTVNKFILEHTSNYLLPNHMVNFYPQVFERKASSDLTCNLSGGRIKKNFNYYIYYPFIESLNNGRCYTLKKKIIAEDGYQNYFPQDIATYEEWYYKVKNAYYNVNSNDIIDFYLLSCECGDSCLELYQLGQSKKRKKVIL